MKNIKGFTLVELLLYFALLGVVVLAASTVWTVLQQQRVKAQTIREVNDQGLAAIQLIDQIVRGATSINSPVAGTSGTSISVNVSTPSLSPTVFNVVGGVLQMTEGSNPTINLTSNKVVSSVSFSNFTRPGTKGSARISFSVNGVTPNLQQYLYSRIFIGAATLR